jgi:hypothetical protein
MSAVSGVSGAVSTDAGALYPTFVNGGAQRAGEPSRSPVLAANQLAKVAAAHLALVFESSLEQRDLAL